VDGIQQTVIQTQIRLCPTHLVPDSPPPELSTSTQQILDSLDAAPDPLDLGFLSTEPEPLPASLSPPPPPPPTDALPPPPSQTDAASHPPARLPTQPTVTADIPPPPPPSGSPPGPSRSRQRRKRNCTSETIHPLYAKALDLVKNGTPTADAIKTVGIAKSTFYKWKALAELKIMDPDQYHALEVLAQNNPSILLMSCKATVLEDTYSQIADGMRKNGELMKRV
jgi:hypothetical protein